ncbi:heme-binding protein [Aestuariicella hydrocarbonica]|uniref:Heme-binding protein n=1 Tax=Pseudomaricurvus hydrocarbonicus TaxID=1470433 RepID=A0A9E5MI33_9GAMM|nr:heme-binding protein [Aestuariicella hydrocarbonica]NHO66786.1 heme-binding protein [Aestuariicella hydrocarbonica]
MILTLDQANKIIDGALAAARKHNANPMAVMVLDAGGHPVAFQREDHTSLYRYDIAKAKASGAVGMGMNTRIIAQRASNNPVFFGSLTTIDGLNLALSAGGVLIKDTEGRILGAVGISGDTADMDEACALAGITAADLNHGVE